MQRLPEAPNRREVEGRIRVLREHIAREQAERDAAEAAAVAPTEDAATAPVTDPLAVQDSDGGGVEGEWWFWTLMVAGVPECMGDMECDDQNSCTVDRCNTSGATPFCEHNPSCFDSGTMREGGVLVTPEGGVSLGDGAIAGSRGALPPR